MLVPEKNCAHASMLENISEVIGRQDDMFLLQKKSGDSEHVVPDLIRKQLQMSTRLNHILSNKLEDEIHVMIQPKIEMTCRDSINCGIQEFEATKTEFLEYEYQPSQQRR